MVTYPPPNFCQVFEFKGLIRKVFRNKDLAPPRAFKMGLGQLRGPSWWTDIPLHCPNQETLSHRVSWMSVIALTGWL
jgi:hypothetical protein